MKTQRRHECRLNIQGVGSAISELSLMLEEIIIEKGRSRKSYSLLPSLSMLKHWMEMHTPLASFEWLYFKVKRLVSNMWLDGLLNGTVHDFGYVSPIRPQA